MWFLIGTGAYSVFDLGRSNSLLVQGIFRLFPSPGGKNYGSKTFLQMDHVIPRAKGGPDTLDNLRLRCRAHNLLAAVEEFGEAKMAGYLHPKRLQIRPLRA